MINDISKIHPGEHWKKWGNSPTPYFNGFSPMVAGYRFSDHTETNLELLYHRKFHSEQFCSSWSNEYSWWFVWDISRCQNDDSHYCITIYRRFNNFRPLFLSNHKGHVIDHGEQNHSKWNFEYDWCSDFYFSEIWKSILCHHWRNPLKSSF